MELTNEFTVPVPVERAWEVLTDVELIAPCLPGAQLQEIEGDEYRGIVKVKVGPITAQYKGAATFTERDEAARRLVLKAEGRDTRGQGSASALITVTMQETGGSTDVVVATDLTIKGKVAQFGRGMIADVSAKLLTQFVECLEGKLDAPAGSAAVVVETPAAAPAPTDAPVEPAVPAPADETETAGAAPAADSGAAEAPATATSGVRKISSPEPEAVDLVDAAGGSVAKRFAPVAVVVLVLWLLGRRRSNKGA
jgi:carbon monoxide dehydrogenase subunit G